MVTLAAGVFAENQNRILHQQGQRAKVSEQLGLVRAKLEGNIKSNIQLVRGLVAVIETQPDIEQPFFSRIASELVGAHSQLRNIAGAPDLVISLMHPIEGNEGAIGLDYRKNERQRQAVMRAVESREMVLTGPVDLVQGGQGFISRFPVFNETGPAERKLWGLVSAVIDAERLYAESGLLDADLPIKISITGADDAGRKGGEEADQLVVMVGRGGSVGAREDRQPLGGLVRDGGETLTRDRVEASAEVDSHQ
ncbi:MAG: CHASE domain-containing protein [Hoeflea sp.]|nr:CHASE domain-containing protein [Hoeflea sp.]